MKGDYFVNKDCIGCQACTDIAPNNFDMKGDRAYVTKQPKTSDERERCAGAKKDCPAEAIKRKIK